MLDTAFRFTIAATISTKTPGIIVFGASVTEEEIPDYKKFLLQKYGAKYLDEVCILNTTIDGTFYLMDYESEEYGAFQQILTMIPVILQNQNGCVPVDEDRVSILVFKDDMDRLHAKVIYTDRYDFKGTIERMSTEGDVLLGSIPVRHEGIQKDFLNLVLVSANLEEDLDNALTLLVRKVANILQEQKQETI